jgi:hypothetical protein
MPYEVLSTPPFGVLPSFIFVTALSHLKNELDVRLDDARNNLGAGDGNSLSFRPRRDASIPCAATSRGRP